jgi:hypothetical protein
MEDKEALRAALIAILQLLQVAEQHGNAVHLHSIDIQLLIAAMRRKLDIALAELEGQRCD